MRWAYPKFLRVRRRNTLALCWGIKIDCDVADDIAAGKRPWKLIHTSFCNIYKGFHCFGELRVNLKTRNVLKTRRISSKPQDFVNSTPCIPAAPGIGAAIPSSARKGLFTFSGIPGPIGAIVCLLTSTIITPPALKTGIACPTPSNIEAALCQNRRCDGG